VTEGINGESGVIKNHGADEEADDQAHHRVIEPKVAHEEAEGACSNRGNEDVFIEPDEFGELTQVLDYVRVIFFVLLGKHPTDVRPVETFKLGGV